MKKRILCTALAVVMLFGVFCTGSVPVRAVRLTLSEQGEAMIKAFEGFSGKPYDDNGKQLSVGWGCGVTAAEWAAIEKNPDGTITEAAAQRLFDSYIDRFGNAVNNFAIQNGLTLTQGQFDALTSFCYNVGSNYLDNPTTTLSKALISGDPEQIAYAIALYGKTSEGHIKRRLLELQMFFYDIYDTNRDWPEKLRYVMLDGNGGHSRYNIYGFSLDHPVSNILVEWTEIPEGKDANGNPFTYEFAGWYDQPVGGNQIKVLDGSFQNGMIVYAHWKNPTTGQIDDLQPGTDVDVKVKATTNVNLREGPGAHYTSVRTAYTDELLHITRVTEGNDGYRWGRSADGWVRLDYTNYGTAGGGNEITGPVTYATVTTGSGLKVRNGPGLSYDRVDSASHGSVFAVLEQQEVTENGVTYVWGKIGTNRWICLKEGDSFYVSLEVVDNTPTEPSDPTAPDISGAITVQSVVITAMPNKLEYALGGADRAVDITGGRVKITYSNGSSKWVAMTRGMTSGFNNTQRGTNTITVTVGGKTTSFDVQIIPINITSISMANLPAKLQYIKNTEQLDLSGVTITVQYAPMGSDTVPVTADMVTGFDNTVTGIQTIVVTYKGFTTSFNVEVVSNDADHISMATLPNKLQYLMGSETLDLTGASIKIHYSITGDEIIPVTPEMVTGFNNTTSGMQRLTVTYKGFTTTFDVEIVLPTVTFLNYDGSVLSSTRYEYGAAVTPPSNPYKPRDAHGEYDFVGWDKEVTNCTGNASYTAVFRLRYPMGDVTQNRKVDEDDAIYLLRHVIFPEKYPLDIVPDYDKDGNVDEDDAIYLLRHVIFPEKYPL